MAKTLLATSALIGTIIGAGFLGIPYVVGRSGFAFGLLHMIIIAAVMILTMLYLAEIALRTEAKHQLTGYAATYIGKRGKKLMFLAIAGGIYAAILAYLVAEGHSLSHLINGSSLYHFEWGIGFWILLSLLTYAGITALKEFEPIGVLLIFVLIITISLLLGNQINPAHLTYVNPENIFVPFGVILFAFLGFSIIPEVREITRHHERSLKRSILLANLITLGIYAVFTLVVLGAKGANTPQIATLALGPAFIILGIITMFTSYLSLSITLMGNGWMKWIFRQDT